MPHFPVMRTIAAIVSAIAVIGLPLRTNAQTFPSKSVTIVVALGAGTGMDALARLYGERLSTQLGKPVVVENRPGGTQNIAAGYVAAAQPDGHTLLVASSAAMAVNPTTYKKLPFDPQRDFVPIAIYVKSAFILLASPSLPVRSVADLVTYSKSNSAALGYGSVGVGGVQQLTMEMIQQRFDIKLTNVPYRNTQQLMTDLTAGHVTVAIGETGASLSLIKAGNLRALAVTAAQRLPSLPNVPAVSESPGSADFEAVSWHVLAVPAKTPRVIVSRLHQEMKEIMASPEVRGRVANLGLIANEFPTIEGMERYMAAEREKWGAMVRNAGLERSQ